MWRIRRAPNNASKWQMGFNLAFKGLNAELNPICHLLALLGAHHILHFSRIRVNNIYTTGKIPDGFKRSIMVMLPKKIKPTKREEHRTLSILTHLDF